MDANGLLRCEDRYCIVSHDDDDDDEGKDHTSSVIRKKFQLHAPVSRCKCVQYWCVQHQKDDFLLKKKILQDDCSSKQGTG